MSSPGSGLARVARTTVLAAVMVALATASHIVAGGHAPELWTLWPAVMVAAGTSYALTVTRANFIATFGVLSLAQLGFHALAEWCPPWCAHPMDHMAEHAGGTGMTSAHLVAALLTALVVSHGDRVLWTLWHWLTRTLRVPTVHSLVVERYRSVFVFERSVPCSEPASGSISRRGPPPFLAFA